MDVYVIYHCNAWKERSSFRLIGVVQERNVDEAYDVIKKECGYTNEDMETYIYVERVLLNDLDI